jgi:predicted DNA-binding transcriptional regulator AlpA
MKQESENKLLVQLNVEELEQLIQRIVESALNKVTNHPLSNPTIHSMGLERELIPRKDLARKLCISLPTIDAWVRYGYLPPKIKSRGKVYFRLSQVDEHLKNRIDA